MTTAQFIAAESFTSLPGSGELTIVADNSTDLSSLNTFLTTDPATTMTIIGHAITITTDSGDVALANLTGTYATLKTNLEAISYPGIPQLSDTTDVLQAQLAGITGTAVDHIAAQIASS